MLHSLHLAVCCGTRLITGAIAAMVATSAAIALPLSAEPSQALDYRLTQHGPERTTADTSYGEVNSVADEIPNEITAETTDETSHGGDNQAIDLDPVLMETSPVLQRWNQDIPNVLSEIRHDPSFRTRLRLGYSQFPANQQAAGFNAGVEDVFLGRSRFTVSGDYQRTLNGHREAYGANAQYYVLPLGSSINLAPVVGYRHITTDRYSTDGLVVGGRLRWVPSRTAAADITLTQSWVAPTTSEEVGISTISLGYAVTPNLRIATDLEQQNAPARKDSRVAIVLEWMP